MEYNLLRVHILSAERIYYFPRKAVCRDILPEGKPLHQASLAIRLKGEAYFRNQVSYFTANFDVNAAPLFVKLKDDLFLGQKLFLEKSLSIEYSVRI